MPHETLNRLLEYSHKNIAMEVENHYVERKERLFLIIAPWDKVFDSFEVPMACWSYTAGIQLCPRSEYEKLETKYLKAKETNEQLLKELQLLKETQGGFDI